MMKLEIACFNLQSALIAQQGGADRIELCADFSSGGLTPNYGTVETARKMIQTELFIMIRPRPGNFVYTDLEFGIMVRDIIRFKTMGVNGFVFGTLRKNGMVNTAQNGQLVTIADPFPCTFHRAFDAAMHEPKTLNDVIGCGFQTVLTSGGAASALEGLERLNRLTIQADGRISIMPGGGIRSSNVDAICSAVKAEFVHSSAILKDDLADVEEVKLLKNKISNSVTK